MNVQLHLYTIMYRVLAKANKSLQLWKIVKCRGVFSIGGDSGTFGDSYSGGSDSEKCLIL